MKIIFIILIGLVLMIFNFVGDAEKMFETIRSVNIIYIIIAMICTVLLTIFTGFAGNALFYGNFDKVSKLDSFLILSTDLFFNGITPFSAGAPPMQVYFYSKKGVNQGDAAGRILSLFILYQIIITFFCIGFLIIFYDYITQAFRNSNFSFGFVFVLIGLFLTILLTVIMCFVGFSKRISRLLIMLVNSFLHLKIFRKHKVVAVSKIEKWFSDLRGAFMFLIKHPRQLFISIFFRILAIICFYLAPFMIARSLGFTVPFGKDFFYLTGVALFAITTMLWIPLPGGSGGVEMAMIVLLLLPSVFPWQDREVVTVIVLLWRFVTYYFGILIGAVAYLIVHLRIKKCA